MKRPKIMKEKFVEHAATSDMNPKTCYHNKRARNNNLELLIT